MQIAILALQGAFIEHAQMLERLGHESVEIRQLSDWERYISTPSEHKALILPGGESTTMMKLLNDEHLFSPIRKAITEGMPVMGTCAGMILLSQDRLGTMDIEVKRNAYGRQLGSFNATGRVEGIAADIPMTFIRAPYIEKIWGEAKTLAVVDGNIVAAQQGNQLACAFHPELTGDTRWHEYFISIVSNPQS